jgi:hypothetical protein
MAPQIKKRFKIGSCLEVIKLSIISLKKKGSSKVKIARTKDETMIVIVLNF